MVLCGLCNSSVKMEQIKEEQFLKIIKEKDQLIQEKDKLLNDLKIEIDKNNIFEINGNQL